MDPLTHIVTGAALSQLAAPPSRAWGALAGVFFAVLPDLDYFLSYNNRLAYLKHHRGFTHSLPALFLFAFAIAALGRLLGGPRWFRPLLLIGVVVLASHFFLDWITSYGTQLLNPFTRAKFSLDWVFIIDFYLTGILAAGALAALISTGWGRAVAAACLGLAGVYIFVCAFYHHQALNLARQAFRDAPPDGCTLAALPQPLSPRRWLLVCQTAGEIRQAFVELPYWVGKGDIPSPAVIPVHYDPETPPRIPQAAYRSPADLEVYLWQAAPSPETPLDAEARGILDTYLEFTRFPLFLYGRNNPGCMTLIWIDLRFGVPGRAIPFVLNLHLDRQGRLVGGYIGGAPLPVTPPG